MLNLRTLALLIFVLLICAQPLMAAQELCFVGNGGHLYLQSIGGSPKQITPDSLTGGICRIPQWMDGNQILFIYDLKPDAEQPKTKVGIFNLQTRNIKWLTSLAGSISVGYDKRTKTIDYMKILRKPPYMETFDVYLGEYPLSTGKAKSSKVFGGGGAIQPKPIWRWPEPGLRLVPLGTSDVSDQMGVWSPSKHRMVSIKWLTDNWKSSKLDTYAVMSFSPGPGKLAASVIGSGEGGLVTILYTINPSNEAVSKIRNSAGVIRSPGFSTDGSWIAWCEEDYQESPSTKTVWASPLSSPQPKKLGGGWDPAWRP